MRLLATLGVCLPLTASAQPQPASNEPIVRARAAWAKKDTAALQSLRDEVKNNRHPLAIWVDYWELNARLSTATPAELDAFYARWPGSYLEDRLRNDWLLELGRRGDFERFRQEKPRFLLDDDREVQCWDVLARQRSGVAQDADELRAAARKAWMAQREADEGCQAMAAQLYTARQLSSADVWAKARQATESGRQRVARHAAGLISDEAASAVGEIFQNPIRYLTRRGGSADRIQSELSTLALVRLGQNDPEAAAAQLQGGWDKRLPPALVAWIWASFGKQAAYKLLPQADTYFQRAETAAKGLGEGEAEGPDDTLVWKARAALRANDGAGRWQQLVQAINAMRPEQQREPVWVYWKARALQVLANDSQNGGALQAQAEEALMSIAGPLDFYGRLAAEALGRDVGLPSPPEPLTPADLAQAQATPGLWRALELIGSGLRSEGVREWNYTVGGYGRSAPYTDRELRAMAQLACDRQIWDRCINTSEKTRSEIDLAQRFPRPFREEVERAAQAVGLESAYVYGLIRQESRFITDARSGVGASGLMQVMPATARWTARKLGIPYANEAITDRETNLRLGSGYLRLLVDDFGGSQTLATAAYNAGPNRPRRWREGPVLEPAAWAENIPFNETRDYVKKVLTNATVYASLIGGRPASLVERLGGRVGPLPPDAPAPDNSLP